MDFKYLLGATATKTIVLLRVGIALIVVGMVLVFAPLLSDRSRTLPELNAQEQELFMMLNLRPELALKYKKFGDIILREKTEIMPRGGSSLLTTYFYQVNKKGDISPIGDRREQHFGNDEVSYGWRIIQGRGDNEMYWTKYTDTLSYYSHDDWSEITNHKYEIGGKYKARIRFKKSMVDFRNSDAVADIAWAMAAVLNADGADRDITRQVKKTLSQDRKVQGGCLNDVFLYDKDDTGNKYFTSILGGAPAVYKYGFDGVQGLHRYTVDQYGKVSFVDDIPRVADGYTIVENGGCTLL